MQRVPLSILAAVIFAACASLAASTLLHTLQAFATESGVASWVFVAVPGLFAALYAMLIYSTEKAQVSTLRQSLSRGLLVGLLTWPSIAALATIVWFPTELFGASLSTLLLVTAAIGGGPMLLAILLAGGLTAFVIRLRLPRHR